MATINRKRLGSLMLQWHSSGSDPIYAVGSFFLNGKRYPDPEIVKRAISSFEKQLLNEQSVLNAVKVKPGREIKSLTPYSLSETRQRARELGKILDGLRKVFAGDCSDKRDLEARAREAMVVQYPRNGHDGSAASIRTCLVRLGFDDTPELAEVCGRIAFF